MSRGKEVPTEARRLSKQKWWAKNKEKQAARGRDRQTAWLSFMSPVFCSRCGYDKCFAAIDAHHLRDKVRPISDLMARACIPKWQQVFKTEMAKCIWLCKNCHAEEHFRMKQEEHE